MQTLEAMLRPKVATLPGHIQAVYVQNAAKLFATVLKSQEGNTDSTAAQETSQLMIDRLPLFVQSANLEVQERVRWRRAQVVPFRLFVASQRSLFFSCWAHFIQM